MFLFPDPLHMTAGPGLLVIQLSQFSHVLHFVSVFICFRNTVCNPNLPIFLKQSDTYKKRTPTPPPKDLRSQRQTLDKVKGFKEFNLIKGDKPDKYSLYASHTVWESKEDFVNWTKSQEFRLAHKGAGGNKSVYLEQPNFEGFEKVL